MTIQGGFAFAYSAFLNGGFLGSGVGSPTISLVNDLWDIPRNSLLVGEENVLTVVLGEYIFLFNLIGWEGNHIDGIYLSI
jgi:hypothetical protein